MGSKNYIAYYRVSTKKQGRSKLGLEAQKAIVTGKVMVEGGTITDEFTEIESGKKDTRIELAKAISKCKETGGTLIIAKLDRLSRSVEFIFRLYNSKVDFHCCDLPELNTLTLGVYSSVAQYERERIVERIKDALRALKARGVILGRPQNLTDESRRLSAEKRRKLAQAKESNLQLWRVAKSLLDAGDSYRVVVEKLNQYGIKSSNQKNIHLATVQRLVKLYKYTR